MSGSFSFRPGPRWQLSANPSYERLTDTQQYVTTMSGGRPEIYNSRYIFAFIDRSTVATEFRMSLTLKPDVNLDVYAEPFAASGRYYDYGELLEPGRHRAAEVRDRRQHPGDQSRRLADRHRGRLDVQPAGTATSTRCRSAATSCSGGNGASAARCTWCGRQTGPTREVLGTYVNVGDMFRSLTAPGRNAFVVKTSFWIPVK